jgi:nucleotide-binding universal stress UspA family protein
VTDGLKPVLLSYDGSEGSATAIAVAGRLLGRRNAIVCHVWSGTSQAVFRTPPSGLPGALSDAAETLDEYDRDIAQQVAAEGAELARSAGFDAEAIVERRETKTWRTLLEAAARNDAAVRVVSLTCFLIFLPYFLMLMLRTEWCYIQPLLLPCNLEKKNGLLRGSLLSKVIGISRLRCVKNYILQQTNRI